MFVEKPKKPTIVTVFDRSHTIKYNQLAYQGWCRYNSYRNLMFPALLNQTLG
jgi:hypothetical protein